MNLTAILSGLTGVGNAIGQGANLAQTLEQWRRYNERVDDPLFTQIRNRFINQANESPYGPYGDPSDSFGGIFGQDAAGKPVQYGDWASRQYMNMMQNNPVNAALSVLQQGANMRSPGVMSIQDILAGNFSGNPQSQPYTGMNFSMPAMPSLSPVDVNGIRTPAPQEPMLDEAKPGHSSGFLETLFGSGGGGRGGAVLDPAPRGGSGGGGGGGGGGYDFQPATPSPVFSDPVSPGRPNPFQPIRSYATGTPYVPQTGVYKLHQGEAVIPKTANPVAQPNTPPPQPAAPPVQQKPDPVNQAAQSNLLTLLKNPESMGRQVQNQMYAQVTDSRDRMLQDQQRQIREAMGAQGMQDSGLRYSLQNQAMNARNTDLTDALRNIATTAAQTNYGNRLNAAGVGLQYGNLGLGQQQLALQRELGLGGLGLQGRQLDIQRELGLGGLGLEGRGLDIQRELGLGGLGVQRELGLGNIGLGQQQLASQHQLGTAAAALQQQDLANQVFQQDRQYNSQLASQIAQLGQLGMSGNIGLMEALGNLINSGMGFNNQQLAQILQQGYQAYAGPDYAAFAYAPNPYVQAQQQQNSGGGSGSKEALWGSLAQSAGQFLGSGTTPLFFA